MLQNIFLIAGLCVLFGGFVSWYRTRNFLTRCVKTKGVVVSHDHQTSDDEEGKTTSSFPIFRFEHPITGMEYTVRSKVSGLMQEGQEIEIIYDPENPKNAKINNLSHTWMIPIIVNILGVFFSFLGILARNTVTTTFSIFDKMIIVLLIIVLILSLGKFIKIKLDAARTRLGDRI
jgi:predicted permease